MNGEGEVFWANQDHGLFVNRRLGACWRTRKRRKAEGGAGRGTEEGKEHDGWHPLIEFRWSALARYVVSPTSCGQTIGWENPGNMLGR